jgi:hypothetical protein
MSLGTAIDKARSLRSKGSAKRVQTILLYTDGEDNGPEEMTLDKILKVFNLRRGENPYQYLKYFTLGVELPPTDKQRLAESKGVTLITNPSGKLAQKLLVQVKPIQLDFGNMKNTDISKREIMLNWPPEANGLSFKVFPEIKSLETLGVIATINPGFLSLTDATQVLALRLANKESLAKKPQANYEGKLIFESPDLLFSPSEIPITLTTEDDPAVIIRSADGEPLNKNFGKLIFDRHKMCDTSWLLELSFNPSAAKKNPTIIVSLEADSSSQPLITNQNIYLSGADGDSINTLSFYTTGSFELDLAVNWKKENPGHYSGKIRVHSLDNSISLQGNGLQPDTAKPGDYLIPFQFDIPSRPFPWLFCSSILVIVIIALVIYKLRPIFPKGAYLVDSTGMTVYLKPKPFHLNLYKVSGSKGDFVLSTIPGEFYIKPLKKGLKLLIKPVPNGIELKDRTGNIIPHEGIILEPDQEFYLAGTPDYKMTYSIQP